MHRYTAHTAADKKRMLDAIGVDSVDDLLGDIPKSLAWATESGVADARLMRDAMAEPDLMRRYQTLAAAGGGGSLPSFVGAGLYSHFVPAAVDSIIRRGEFFTAYTPYQPEASQGTLQAIFEFQTTVCQLMELDVANASVYDGASAAAEAALLALRAFRPRRGTKSSTSAPRIVLCEGLHPDYVATVRTYLHSVPCEVITASIEPESGRVDLLSLKDLVDGGDVAAVLVQSPNCLGVIERLESVAQIAHDAAARAVAVVNDPSSLGLLKPPGACGVDIAVGEGTGIGLPPSFGGPGVGLFAARQDLVRQMPGRLVGQARDADGKLGYVLTLATREQHIRRERATSNICTNHGLCALAFTVHAALLGKTGFRDLATRCADGAAALNERLHAAGIKRRFSAPSYNELVVELGDADLPGKVISRARERGIVAGFDLGRWRTAWAGGLLVCVNELHTSEQVDLLVDTIVECAR